MKNWLLSLLLVLSPILQNASRIPGPGGAGSGGGGGVAPTYVTACATFSFSSPTTCSVGTVNVGDWVGYFVSPNNNSPTITPSLTGACAATGGNVTDLAAANQGFVAGSSQLGHFVITTGGSCTVSVAYSGGTGGTTDAPISAWVVRSVVTGVNAVSTTYAAQSPSGTGANIIASNSISTSLTSLCLAGMVDHNFGGGTLTAGTTIAWTNLVKNNSFPNGNESFAQSS